MTTPAAASLDQLRGKAANLPTAGAAPRTMTEIMAMKQEKQLPAMLEAFKRQIAVALPSHLTADRMSRLALTAFNQNPTLAKCEPLSVFASVIVAAQLGLEIGIDGQGYLVPYYDNRAKKYRAQFIPGWKGRVELVHRAGKASVWTGAVFKGDKFAFQLGDEPYCRHQPMGESDEVKANLTHVYAIGRIKGQDTPIIEVWTKARVERHLARYNKVGDKHYALVNDNNWIQYAKKVALLQVEKYLPKSVEQRAADALERGAEVDLQAVIEGEWSVVAAAAPAYDENDEGAPGDTGGSLPPEEEGSQPAGDGAGQASESAAAATGESGQDPSPDPQQPARSRAPRARDSLDLS